MKLLVLDNYDSFTYNLVHLIEKVDPSIHLNVIRNDKINVQEVTIYDKILLSPGPGLPKDAGIMPQLLKTYTTSKSILGVCLGLQAIGECFGGTLENLSTVYHGLSTPIHITEKVKLFENCPVNFQVGRYHSWVVNKTNLPEDLQITALDDHSNIMALSHRKFDVQGVQFHPESILSEFGEQIIINWLKA